MICLFGVTLAHTDAAGEKTFKDVTTKHWAYQSVQTMIQNGIISGYTDGTFRPKGKLTREQFATMLTLALDLDLVSVKESTFSDVKSNSWSSPYIETVKDYLEGYIIGPVSFYKPKDIVTREEVAVALVKAMKLETNSANAEEVIRKKVTDYNSISPGLAPYVAVAIENRLIEGYDDRTFKPTAGLDRASAASLLSRFLESPIVPSLEEIVLTVEMPDSAETGKVQASGTVSSEAKLYVNEEAISQTSGSFDKIINLTKGEGSYNLEFKAVLPNGRYKTVIKPLKYTIPGPDSFVTVQDYTEKQTIIVSGEVTDLNDAKPVITVNDIKVSLLPSGEWSMKIQLHEGNNVISVIATNKHQKSSIVKKNVQFTVKPPALTVESVSEVVNNSTLKVKGTVSDLNDSNPKVYLNDVLISENGSFEKSIVLKEGDNLLEFEATNSLGKRTVITKKVKYVILPPEILFENLEETTLLDKVTLKVTAVDMNDTAPELYLNDRYMNTKSFTTTVTLKEGENTFTVRAKNKLGKEKIVVKKITYLVLPPNLLVDPIPETTTLKTVSVKVTATDFNDKSPYIYINNVYKGMGTYTGSISLVEGENTLSFKATSSTGKSSVVVKKITYVVAPPVVTVDTLPETTTTKTITITASATDSNDSYPKLYLNGQYITERTFTRTVNLTEGENVFQIYATNNLGKTSETLVKKVTYVVPGPTLTVGPIPETTSTSQLTLTASATDLTDTKPKLYLNGEYISERTLSKTVTLTEGENIFEFKATNAAGKTSEIVVRRITYLTPGPILTVGTVPETTNTAQITLTASATDVTDPAPLLYLNNQYVNDSSFSSIVNLVEGENIFEFKAVNSSGKVSNIIIKRIIYQPAPPAPPVTL